MPLKRCWRESLAIISGAAYCVASTLLGSALANRAFPQLIDTLATVNYVLIVPSVSVGTYMFLARRYGLVAMRLETRCRRCNYVLQRLLVPTCPICGEQI
jgi:hypothetical protein